MKLTLIATGLGFLLIVASSMPVHADLASGGARLHQVDRSEVQARFAFLDTGTLEHGLVVSATATGLDPTQAYFSLVYDVASVPGGPQACVPGSGALTQAQMALGFWQVSADGTGRLFAQKTGDGYAPLAEIGAVSVRVVVGPPPAGFILQACGQVHGNSR